MLGAVLVRARRRARSLVASAAATGWRAFWVVGLASPGRDLRARLLGAHRRPRADALGRRAACSTSLGAARRVARRAGRGRAVRRAPRPCAPRRSCTWSSRSGSPAWCCSSATVRLGAADRPSGVAALVGRGRDARGQPAARAADPRHRRPRGARVAGTATGAGHRAADRVAGGADHRGRHRVLRVAAVERAASSAVIVVALVARGRLAPRERDRRRAVVGGAVLLGARASSCTSSASAQGSGFVPGLLVASPFAAVGLCPRVDGAGAAAGRRRSRCVALPDRVVRAVLGRCRPAVGRSLHPALGRAPRGGRRAWCCEGTRRAFVAVVVARRARHRSAASAGSSVRSHTVADGMATIVARHDQVLISPPDRTSCGKAGRSTTPTGSWLTATTDAELAEAVRDRRGDRGRPSSRSSAAPTSRRRRRLGEYDRGRTAARLLHPARRQGRRSTTLPSLR